MKAALGLQDQLSLYVTVLDVKGASVDTLGRCCEVQFVHSGFDNGRRGLLLVTILAIHHHAPALH